ncbi:MAG: hypothetical protein ACOCV2_13385, partial [Persicimonas sp.]
GDDLELATEPETLGDQSDVPVTRLSTDFEPLSPGDYEVVVEVEDAWGNADSTTQSLLVE